MQKGSVTMLETGSYWVITKITDAHDETVNKLVDRNRIGKVVRNVYDLEADWPLHLAYFGGEKDGGVIQHSRIERVEEVENGMKVYTANTMVQLVAARQVYPDERLEAMWDEFSTVPITNRDEIETAFHGWPVGTNRFDVWAWFDRLHTKGIRYLTGERDEPYAIKGMEKQE